MGTVTHIRHASPWVPLAIALALVIGSLVTGRGPESPAAGATVVPVTGSNAAVVSIDTTGCTPGSTAIGELVPGTDPWKTAQDEGGATCSIDFGTTNGTLGANLDVLEDPSAPPSPAAAMKCTGGGCSGHAIADFSGSGEPAAGTSAFGAQLLGAGSGASAVWSAAPAVHAIADTSDTACQTSAIGMGNCTFTFGATAAASDPAGSYEAQVRYVVLAR